MINRNGKKIISIYSCDIEPGEKVMRRLSKFVFMILAFVVAIVFGDFLSDGLAWSGDFGF